MNDVALLYFLGEYGRVVDLRKCRVTSFVWVSRGWAVGSFVRPTRVAPSMRGKLILQGLGLVCEGTLCVTDALRPHTQPSYASEHA